VGRTCTICSHENRYDIDSILVDRAKPYRYIALQYGVSKDAISRHVNSRHISELLALAADAEQAARADTLLDRVEALQSRIEAFLGRVEGTDNYSATLGAFREMRANLDLIGEVTKELDRTPTLNLELNPEWLRVEAVIVGTLERFPAAKEAVVGALLALPDGEDGYGGD